MRQVDSGVQLYEANFDKAAVPSEHVQNLQKLYIKRGKEGGFDVQEFIEKIAHSEIRWLSWKNHQI